MAQFTGVITLEEEKRGRKMEKKIFVKGDMVKIESYMPNGDLKGAKIINTSTGKVTALIPARNLYFEVPESSVDREIEAAVKRTGKTQSIAGYDTKQLIVVNKANQTAVVFWMAKDDFDFFAPMMQALSKNDAVSSHFEKLEDKGGVMPMKIVERKPDGQVMFMRTVTNIDREANVSDSDFEVPEGYSLMER